MIKDYTLYSVQCDLCEMSYPGTTESPVIHFQSPEAAIETISSEGWGVRHNDDIKHPLTFCPGCRAGAEATLDAIDMSELFPG